MAGSHRTPRAERTRAALLDAAERLFAERGFAATRLEDVAREVGIRRASIVYHFPDKAALHEAVLGRALGELRERVEGALGGDAALEARIEAAVGAWVDTVVERPALARLVLREVLDGEGPPRALLAQAAPFARLFEKTLAEGRRPQWAGREELDPLQLVSVIVGATVFFVGALPRLAPPGTLGPARREEHRRALRRLVRGLLAAESPPPARSAGEAEGQGSP